jgi:hypothetical protein
LPVMRVVNRLAVQFSSERADDLVKRPIVILQLNHRWRLDALPGSVHHDLSGQIGRGCRWRGIWWGVLRADRVTSRQRSNEDHPT